MTDSTCIVADCGKPRHHGGELCDMHRKRVERHGDLNGGLGRGAPGRPRKPRTQQEQQDRKEIQP